MHQELDCNTRLIHQAKWSLRIKKIYIVEWKCDPFLKETKEYEKNVKIFPCDKADKNKALKEDCVKNFKYIDFEFTLSGNPKQWCDRTVN